jgi:hypothetical protein
MTTPAFTSSPLYSLDSIDALLTRLPRTSSRQKEGEETRIQLLSAKLSLLQSSIPPSTSATARNVQQTIHRNVTAIADDDDDEERRGADALQRQQQHQQLDLTETRCELVDCYLRQGNLVLGESEALQIVATCKKIVKLPPPLSKPTTTGTTPLVPESRTATSKTPTSASTHSAEPSSASSGGPVIHPTSIQPLRWSRAYDRALSALMEIDTQRGIVGRAERWRGMRDRLRSNANS